MSTISTDGVCNLAPMSYFNMVSHNPPTIMVSVMSSATNPDGLKGASLTMWSADSRYVEKRQGDWGVLL